jgi:hypothetical protein
LCDAVVLRSADEAVLQARAKVLYVKSQHAALLAMEADELLNDIRPSLDLIDDTSVSMEHDYVALERMMLVPGVANVVNRRLADIKSASEIIIDEVAQVLETIDDYIYDDNILVDDPDLEMPEDIANLPPGLAFH